MLSAVAKGIARGAAFSFGGHRSRGELSVGLIGYELWRWHWFFPASRYMPREGRLQVLGWEVVEF